MSSRRKLFTEYSKRHQRRIVKQMTDDVLLGRNFVTEPIKTESIEIVGQFYQHPQSQQIIELNDKKMIFYIVEFENGLGIVPETWFLEDKTMAFYPLCSLKLLHYAIQNNLKPEIKDKKMNWKLLDIKQIFGTSDNFKCGLEKLRMAEIHSNNDTENEQTLISHEGANISLVSDEEERDIDLLQMSILPMISKSKKLPSPEMNKNVLKRNEEYHGVSHILKKQKVNDIFLLPSSSQITDEMPKLSKEKCDCATKLMQKMNKILLELNSMNYRLQTIEEHIQNVQYKPSYVASTFQDFDELPIKDVKELEEFDAKLIDEDFSKKMENILSLSGGSGTEQLTKGILKKLALDDVYQHYSLKGKKQKRCFMDLNKIMLLIYRTVRRAHRGATDVDIHKTMSSYLVNAPKRLTRTLEKTQLE
ncbi:uncharacterized protein [Prorops nasuta]|uniref:uncharacterized protein n=1 Tax=Prorops nasuta TaxID=863751 RepID=UPI0034CD781D